MKAIISYFTAILVALLLSCGSHKNHPASQTQDSLPLPVDSNVFTARPADTSRMNPDSGMVRAMADSSSALVKLGDSVLSMVKDSLGKNAGMLDGIMKALKENSSNTSTSASGVKDSVAYHEPLADNYAIPVTGSGNGIKYEYAGGSVFNGKKSGITFSILFDQYKKSKWNMFFNGAVSVPQFNISSRYSCLMNQTYTHLLLNDDHKVYASQTIDQSIHKKNYSVSDISVTKIGTEKLHGFSCVHAHVSFRIHFMGVPESNEFDIWRSEEVPGAADMESSIQIIVSPLTLDIENKLANAGCKGVILKVTWKSRNTEINKELINITRQNIPGSVFQVPEGYREDKNAALYSLF